MLREATATARTIGMRNNESKRRQLPPGEVGWGETSKPLPLNPVELAKRWAKTKQF